MSPQPRRLSFAVGTTLLTASLATGAAGCQKKGPTVNVAEPPEEVYVNEGPQPEPDEPIGEDGEDGEDVDEIEGEEPPHVNTQPNAAESESE
ncbi:hypothetical protein DB30_00181 [Enhygromyxa salina]|uniref:Lipoprotein n=1 Tax=Enhygromyxa salina TaxID=215803 RepID=A0A0C2D5N4_9BACT|nr:hypothetical protein [Enhygromyxa salina]KIG18496.1 hypothetical protein DB30_00181 [Enhygromyxa salina]